ncbi:MAG: hypothetical protein ACI84K_000217 [Pseudohongiellaceae bacterium]|jgi:hypothetical protein
MISEQDLDYIRYVETAEEALQAVRQHIEQK